MVTAPRIQGATVNCSVMTVKTKPSTNAPLTLTANVPDGEDARLLVAHDEPGAGRRVVVVEELEEEAEAAVMAGDGLVVEPLLAVAVDRSLLAVRADEVGHRIKASHAGALRRAEPRRAAASRRGAAGTRREPGGRARRRPEEARSSRT